MPRPFKTTYDDDRTYVVSGRLLNEQAQLLNQAGFTHVVDPTLVQASGSTADAEVHPRHAKIGLATIVDDEEKCDVDRFGYTKAPCPSEGLYLAEFRYFDGEQRRWLDYPEPLPLDASSYGDVDQNDPTGQPIGGDIPTFAVGDIVPAYWDDIRGMLIPIATAESSDDLTLEAVSQTAQQIASGSDAIGNNQLAEMYLEIRTPDLPDFVPIAAISWRQPYIDKLHLWNETRAGFATFEAPEGTVLRFRAVHQSVNEPWLNRVEAMFFSIAEKTEENFHERIEIDNHAGGAVVTGFQTRTDVPSTQANAPLITHDGQTFSVTYPNGEGRWLLGINFAATLFNVVNEQTDDVCYEIVTNVDCLEGDILEYCKREFCFPAEIANRMNVLPEFCVVCTTVVTPPGDVSSASSLSSVTSVSTESSLSSSTLSTESSLSTSTQSTLSSISTSVSSISTSLSSESSISSSTLSTESSLSTSSTLSSSSVSTESSLSSSTLSSLSTSTESSISTQSSQSTLSTLSTSSTLSSLTTSSQSTESSLSSSTVSSESSLSSSTLSSLSSSTVSSVSSLSSSSVSSLSSLSSSSTVRPFESVIVPFQLTAGTASGTFEIGGTGTAAEGFGTPVAAMVVLSGSTRERDQIIRDINGHPIRDISGNPIHAVGSSGLETDELLSIGITDGTNEKVAVSFAANGVTTMAAARNFANAMILEIDQTGAEGQAVFSSFGTDTLTLEYTAAFDQDYRGYAILMKGAHKVTVGEVNQTSSGSISLGYKPSFGVFIAADTTTYDNSHGFLSFGVAGRNGDGDPSQWAHTRYYGAGGATVDIGGGLHNSLMVALTNGSAVQHSLSMSSWDDDGFSVTLSGTAVRFAYLTVETPGDQLSFAETRTLTAGDGQTHTIEPDYTGAGSGDYTELAIWAQTNTTSAGMNNDATAEGYSVGAAGQCVRQALAGVFDDFGEGTAEAGSAFSSAELGLVVTGGDTTEKLLRAYDLDDVDINTVYDEGGGSNTRIGYLAIQASDIVSTCSSVSSTSTLSTSSASTLSTLSTSSSGVSTQSTSSSMSETSQSSMSTESSLSTSQSSISTSSTLSSSSSSQSNVSSLSSPSTISSSESSISTSSTQSSSSSSLSDASSVSSESSISSSVSSQSTSSTLSSSSIGCTDVCDWTWTAGTPDFWDIGIPCENDPLGLGLCTCDEPPDDGDFYGQVVQTKCYEA